MKTTLFSILWNKEKMHWKRIKQIFGKFNNWIGKISFGFVVVVLVTVFHYAFAVMHTLYEILLFIFTRETFKRNLEKLALTI